MNCAEVVFTRHAVEQMFERGIGQAEVLQVLREGLEIAAYPEDRPFPSYLMLGGVGERPIHVVVAVEQNGERCYVVTSYVPDPALWNDDFTQRRLR